MSMPAAAAALVRSRALALGAVLALLGLAGCSSASNTAVTITGSTLTIYAGRPPGGAGGQAAADVLDAEQLAFRQSGDTAGKFTLRFVKLNGREISDDARSAVEDQSAIAYLGELEPGTSQTSVEITNELDLLQVSPTDTAIYLTQSTPAEPSSPTKYYPTGSTYGETFARVVPNTAQEAQAIAGEMQALHLSRVYLTGDGGPYGASIVDEVRQDVSAHGLTAASTPSGADAVFYGGNSPAAAVRTLDAAATAAPNARLFVPSALYDDSFVSQLAAAAQKNLYVSSPGFTAGSLTAAGRQFESSFSSAYGHAPVPEAIFGYEAVSAVIAVLKEAGAKADQRAVVVHDFLSIKDRQSVLGTYSIHDGDTTIAPFVFARVQNGQLVPSSTG